MADNENSQCVFNIFDCIRDMFKLFVRKQWLKEINRQFNSVNRLVRKIHHAKQDLDRKCFVLQKLIDEYKARYHDSLCVKEGEHAGD